MRRHFESKVRSLPHILDLRLVQIKRKVKAFAKKSESI